MFVKKTKKPNLASDVERDLLLLGVEGVRDLLRVSTDGYSGTGGLTVIQLLNTKGAGSELLNWLRWRETVKARRANRRFCLTLALSAIAAVAAVIAAIKGWPHG